MELMELGIFWLNSDGGSGEGTCDLWICGPVDIWTCGSVDLWIYGSVDLWILLAAAEVATRPDMKTSTIGCTSMTITNVDSAEPCPTLFDC